MLESLKSSKFEDFKFNELDQNLNIFGGKTYLARKLGGGSFTDCWDEDFTRDVKTSSLDGGSSDAYDRCST